MCLCHAVFNLLFNIESGTGNPGVQIACKQLGVELCDFDANVGSPLVKAPPHASLRTQVPCPSSEWGSRTLSYGPSSWWTGERLEVEDRSVGARGEEVWDTRQRGKRTGGQTRTWSRKAGCWWDAGLNVESLVHIPLTYWTSLTNTNSNTKLLRL